MMPFQQPLNINALGTGSKNLGGRPKKVGQPIVLRAPEQDMGFEFSTDPDPEVIASAKRLYLNSGKNAGLPLGLAPTRVRRPGALEAGRSANISKGWRKPRQMG